MNKPVGELISDIFNRHEDNTKEIIQDLFLLMANCKLENHQIIHRSILYAMEILHQWTNIIKYAEKWKMEDYKKELIKRMKKRLNQKEEEQDPNMNTKQELRRLVEKYWKQRSPKRQENVYTEPIFIQNIKMNIKSKEQSMHIEKPNQQSNLNNQNQQHNEPDNIKTDSNTGKASQKSKISESTDKEKEDNVDPLSSLTGRPSILKRSSVIDIRKTSQQGSDSNSFKPKSKPNTRVTSSNLAKLLINQNKPQTIAEEKQSNQKDRPTKNEEALNKLNEAFPIQKFSFGSQKKGRQSEILKKMTISPQKFQPEKKIIRIKRPDFNLDEQKDKNNLEFSFTNDYKRPQHDFKMTKFQVSPHKVEQKIQIFKRQSLKGNNIMENQFDSFAKEKDSIFKPSENQESIVKNLLVNDSFANKSKQKNSTPVFPEPQQKGRRSQNQMSYFMNEVNMIAKQVKPKNHIQKLEYKLKMTSLQLFQEAFGF